MCCFVQNHDGIEHLSLFKHIYTSLSDFFFSFFTQQYSTSLKQNVLKEERVFNWRQCKFTMETLINIIDGTVYLKGLSPASCNAEQQD